MRAITNATTSCSTSQTKPNPRRHPATAGDYFCDLWQPPHGLPCSLLDMSCARQLQQNCNIGGPNKNDSRCLRTSISVGGIVAAGVAFVILVAVAYFLVRRRRAQAQLARRRASTMDLLQSFVEGNTGEDLREALLPADCIDFGPSSPCIAVGGCAQVFKCIAVISLSRRMKLRQTVALKEVFCMMSRQSSPEASRVGVLVGGVTLGAWAAAAAAVLLDTCPAAGPMVVLLLPHCSPPHLLLRPSHPIPCHPVPCLFP